MDWFTIIRSFYNQELWTATQVGTAVQKGKITAEQYQTITGQPYGSS